MLHELFDRGGLRPIEQRREIGLNHEYGSIFQGAEIFQMIDQCTTDHVDGNVDPARFADFESRRWILAQRLGHLDRKSSRNRKLNHVGDLETRSGSLLLASGCGICVTIVVRLHRANM